MLIYFFGRGHESTLTHYTPGGRVRVGAADESGHGETRACGVLPGDTCGGTVAGDVGQIGWDVRVLAGSTWRVQEASSALTQWLTCGG